MTGLVRNGVRIDDTFAEAFDMVATALVITGPNRRWANQAAISATGFATSIIACGAEAAIDRELSADETPDGRPGVRILLFAGPVEELQKQVTNRVGQCVLTCVGSACYAGLAETEGRIKVGDALRYFADGWQISKRLGGRHFWRLPVMDGEFVCEGTTGLTKSAVGGGNFLLLGRTYEATLRAAEAAADAVAAVRRTPSRRSPAASCAQARRSGRNTRRCLRRPIISTARPCAAPRTRHWTTTRRRCWKS